MLILCCLAIVLVTFLGAVKADREVNAVTNLIDAGEILSALTLLETLKPLRPCDPDLLFVEARVYEAAGETDRAIALYELLIDVFPNIPEPYNNAAALYAARGAIYKAEQLLLGGLGTHNKYKMINENLSNLYIARAAEAYRKALNIETEPGSENIISPILKLLDPVDSTHSDNSEISITSNECIKFIDNM